MNVHLRHIVLGATLMLATACGRPKGDAAEATAKPSLVKGVDLAVATAQAIRAEPLATDSILEVHGLTRASFDSLMYDIAADSALARSYAEAMR